VPTATHLLRLGHACDHACLFCTVADDPDPELSREEALERLDSLPLPGGVTVTGGEPTMHPALEDLVRRARERGLSPVDLQTHGARLADRALAERLAGAGLGSALVAIPSHLPRLYRELVGSDDLARVLEGIENLLASGVEVNVDHVVTSRTLPHLPAFADFVGERLPGVNRILLSLVRPNGACARHLELVPRLVDAEPFLYAAMDRLRSRGAFFEVEGVPLCYLQGFEHHCAETQRALDAPVSYVGGERRPDVHGFIRSRLKRKADACRLCPLDPLCEGVWSEYAALHGTGELFRVPTAPERVRGRLEAYYRRWREARGGRRPG
jgi:MoaA/NifB/PqqE/SkfB family radical SAM enzyme